MLRVSFLPYLLPAKVISSLFPFNGISQLTQEAKGLPLTIRNSLFALTLQELILNSLIYSYTLSTIASYAGYTEEIIQRGGCAVHKSVFLRFLRKKGKIKHLY